MTRARRIVLAVIFAMPAIALQPLLVDSATWAQDVTAVDVPATSMWVDTGLVFSSGQVGCVVAYGLWKPDPNQPTVSLMGRAMTLPSDCGTCPVRANHGALVARVGTNAAFVVGHGMRFRVQPGSSGNLALMINDATESLADNSGSVTAIVGKGSAVCRALGRNEGSAP